MTFAAVKYRLVSFDRALPQNDSQDFSASVLPFLKKNGKYTGTWLAKTKQKILFGKKYSPSIFFHRKKDNLLYRLLEHKWAPASQAKNTHRGVHTQVHLQLTSARDQTNNPRAAIFLGTVLVFPSPASVALSPTPDNEERGSRGEELLKTIP